MQNETDHIAFERGGVKVNTTKKQMATLIDSLVFDDKFRARFSREYVDILQKEGIKIDADTVKKLNAENVGAFVSGMVPHTKNPAAVAVIAAVIVVATAQPAE
ncbi:hypothetical protein [Chlorobium ferrooxidans]|uniref:Uncharacterized protein n=1 Tax=Chlorobium ferrooxidans DSM 13031 TaxID=377431 RepID=Q0YRQ8_9CHLB|nr:hypothetical protein [Chlorobium ferrooxidans]EAT58998.1 hypothetical protein CferDRAFT_0972 [Chlorobium ferrooxidans DSM 13031]